MFSLNFQCRAAAQRRRAAPPAGMATPWAAARGPVIKALGMGEQAAQNDGPVRAWCESAICLEGMPPPPLSINTHGEFGTRQLA